jgi:LysM repeat protein
VAPVADTVMRLVPMSASSPTAAAVDSLAKPRRVARRRVVTPLPSDPALFAPVPSPVASPRPASVVVAPGETLYSIGRRWGVSVPALMMENDLVSEKVPAGARLKLPAAPRSR